MDIQQDMGNIPAAGYDLQNGLRKAYLLMEQGVLWRPRCTMSAQAKVQTTVSVTRGAEDSGMPEAGREYDAAYIKAKQLLLKDYGYARKKRKQGY